MAQASSDGANQHLAGPRRGELHVVDDELAGHGLEHSCLHGNRRYLSAGSVGDGGLRPAVRHGNNRPHRVLAQVVHRAAGDELGERAAWAHADRDELRVLGVRRCA